MKLQLSCDPHFAQKSFLVVLSITDNNSIVSEIPFYGHDLACLIIHLPRKQHIINRKGHRHAANEGIDSYRQAIDHMEIRPDQ